MNIAVIGVGRWGPNLVCNFLNHPEVEKVHCYDIDSNRLKDIHKTYPYVEVVSSFDEILKSEHIEAVAISTPVFTHFSLAKQALEHNKNVLVEKPLSLNSSDAQVLINIAREKNLILMVDHVSLYNGAIRKIKEIVDSGEIGDIMYFDAVRINFGFFQQDVNVLWDLAIHDISIIDYFLKDKPRAVRAVGERHYSTLEDIAYLILYFDNHCIGHIHVSWLAPLKIRRILIGGTKKMILFDDIEPSEKIKIYEKQVKLITGQDIYQTQFQYQIGDMLLPKYDITKPLKLAVDDFIRAIKDNREPLTNGEAGLNIVRILEAAEQSIKENGKIVELND